MNRNNTATWRMYAFSIIVACLHFNDTHGLNGLIIINNIYSTASSKINTTNPLKLLIIRATDSLLGANILGI